ncbi:rhodanese family protein [Sandarakinorhabdus sp. AAP62]|uniref:rhodanese family protein n=1 Tax=Sandarakinorhabdus sp. AAP62 TaxID=1248916 RepID=UPI0003027BFA|nr:rhodanese family protein [Sandarakinorhabdus sp. AAP62]
MLKSLSPSEAATLVDAGHALLVDVREAGEFAGRHIPGALSLPLSLPDSGPLACGMDSSLIFTCQTGRRTSSNAGRLLARVPGGRAFVLEGGVDAWARAGLPIAGSEATQAIPIMRQVQIAAGLLVLTGVLLSIFVAPPWIALAGFVGAGLSFAGLTGWCGMAQLLGMMPWNRRTA